MPAVGSVAWEQVRAATTLDQGGKERLPRGGDSSQILQELAGRGIRTGSEGCKGRVSISDRWHIFRAPDLRNIMGCGLNF